MCRSAWTIIFLNFLALAVSTPVLRKKLTEEAETSLDRFLNLYLGQVEKVNGVPEDDLYETMQGDEPHEQNTIHQIGPNSNFGDNRNLTSSEYSRAMRNRKRPNDLDERLGENRIQLLKDKILNLIGRKPDDVLPSLNMTENIPKDLNNTDISIDDQITEKIRSFYPSCEIPINTDQDLWKDDDTMNLFFNFEFFTESKNANIATATLRLYRLPENSTKPTMKPDCDNLTSAEEDRLLRVSIYWYTKSLKKRRVKRRLSDSKVISETSKWVELSVKAAAKAWTRGRNLGMGILVEDQEGNTLKAARVFKGASCTQRPSQSPPLSSMQLGNQTNLTEFIAYLDEIQQQPYIVTYICYRQ